MSALLTILGCGPSTGVPIPACGCEVCRSAHPRNKRLRHSALLTLETGERILIDTSPDLRQQALRAEIPSVAAVLFTHAHADHILGLDDLRAFAFVQNQAIPCYATAETLTEIRRTFQYVFHSPSNYKGGMLPQVELHEISHQRFGIAGVRFQAFPLLHGDGLVTGFRSGNLGYATDCNALPPEAVEALHGVEHLVIDGLRERPHGTHFTILEAVAAAQQLEARHVYLTHLSHTVDYETAGARLPDNVKLAYDGLTITFEPDREE